MESLINSCGMSGVGRTWLGQEVMAASQPAVATTDYAPPSRRPGSPDGLASASSLRRTSLDDCRHHDGARGGTDASSPTDGRLDETFRPAQSLARHGTEVLIEMCQHCGAVERTADLPQSHGSWDSKLQVFWLDLPRDTWGWNVVARRPAGQAAIPSIGRTVRAGHEALLGACHVRQRAGISVERRVTVAAPIECWPLALPRAGADGQTRGPPASALSLQWVVPGAALNSKDLS